METSGPTQFLVAWKLISSVETGQCFPSPLRFLRCLLLNSSYSRLHPGRYIRLKPSVSFISWKLSSSPTGTSNSFM